MPSIGTLVAHVFYVQSFFGVPAKISGVYWTLCQEVQLYLAFILFIWIAQSLTRKYVSLTAQLTMWIMMAVGVLSLLFDYQLVPRPGVIDLEGQSIDRIDALFFRYWHYFLIGVLAEKFLRRAPWGVQYFVFWMILEIAFRLGCKFEDTRLIAYTLTALPPACSYSPQLNLTGSIAGSRTRFPSTWAGFRTASTWFIRTWDGR